MPLIIPKYEYITEHYDRQFIDEGINMDGGQAGGISLKVFFDR